MRFCFPVLSLLVLALVSCGTSGPSGQPQLRTVTYEGSDWSADDIAVSVSPAPDGWRVDVASTLVQPADTLLLELHFDQQLVATGGESSCPEGEVSLLATGRPGVAGLGVIMPEGETMQPGVLMSFTLAPAGRMASLAANATYVDDLAGIGTLGNVALSWSYHFAGDYDQNGIVTISDISVLGPRLGNSTSDGTDDERDALADGDGNGLVTLADLTPIGAALGSGVEGYNVYSANALDIETATSTLVANVAFSAAITPSFTKLYEFDVTDPLRIADEHFYVRPLLDGAESTLSNVIQVDEVVPSTTLFGVPPAGQTTVDNTLSQSPSLVIQGASDPDIAEGAPLIAYTSVSGGGELRFAYYRDGSWQNQVAAAGQYTLPQLYIDGSNRYIVAFDAVNIKLVRLQYDAALNLTGTEDITPVSIPPTFIDVSYFPPTGHIGVAYGFSPVGGDYEVGFAENSGGTFNVTTVGGAPGDTLAGLTFGHDSSGEEWLFYTHGTIDPTTLQIDFTLERAEFDGSVWTSTPVAYPDSPLVPDLMFASNGNPRLTFNAARDKTFVLPPITLSFQLDSVVGEYDGANWTFEKAYTSTLDLAPGGGFPPTTGIVSFALCAESVWAREGEVCYTEGAGDIEFSIADFSPVGGALATFQHYAKDNGAAYVEDPYFTGGAGIAHSWAEIGSMHGSAYILSVGLTSADLIAGNFSPDSSLLYWRK